MDDSEFGALRDVLLKNGKAHRRLADRCLGSKRREGGGCRLKSV